MHRRMHLRMYRRMHRRMHRRAITVATLFLPSFREKREGAEEALPSESERQNTVDMAW